MRGFNLEKEENKADEQYKSIIEALRAAAPDGQDSKATT